jgi:tRNA A37 threonylcarbamoyladenosine dehydratase
LSSRDPPLLYEPLRTSQQLIGAGQLRGQVTSGGAGGLADPTAVQCVDIAKATCDTLLFRVRKKLRQRYGFPKGTPSMHHKRIKPWGIRAVFSEEPLPLPPEGADSDGSDAVVGFRACDVSFGTCAAVTGAFGLALAAEVVRDIAHGVAAAPRVKLRPPEPGSEGLLYRRSAASEEDQG